MGHIVQRLVRNAIMQAVNQVIQKLRNLEMNGRAVFIVWYPGITAA